MSDRFKMGEQNTVYAAPAVNRRMDEWTTLDHVDLSSVTTSEAELATAADPGNRYRTDFVCDIYVHISIN